MENRDIKNARYIGAYKFNIYNTLSTVLDMSILLSRIGPLCCKGEGGGG